MTAGARRAAVVLVVAASLFGGCARRFVLPTGAAVAAPDTLPVWDAITQACRNVTSLRAELRVSGEVRDERFPSLTTGVAVDAGHLAMVATYSARAVFNVAGTASDMVLLDHVDRRVYRGDTPAIVDSLVGVRLGPDRLLALLTGCVSAQPSATAGVRIGDLVRIDLFDSHVYLAEDDGTWRLRAASFDDVLADYRRVEEGWPREIELRRGDDVRVRIRVIEWEHNPTLRPALFQLSVPASYVPTPLD